MSDTVICPKCKSDLTYPDGSLMICSQCFHEWNPAEEKVEQEGETAIKILDSNGNELKDGDTVIIIKDLPVKGPPNL